MIQSKLYLLLARSRPGSTSFVAMNEVGAGRDRATPTTVAISGPPCYRGRRRSGGRRAEENLPGNRPYR